MEIPGPDSPCAPVQVLAESILPGGEGKDAGQQHGCRNGGAFKIGHPVPTQREAFSGYIISSQSAHPAADEVGQHDPVPPSLKVSSKSEGRRCNSEGDNISQRIQFTPDHRLLMPPSSHQSIEPVEEKRRWGQGCGGEENGGATGCSCSAWQKTQLPDRMQHWPGSAHRPNETHGASRNVSEV